jgi:hypothetical protein
MNLREKYFAPGEGSAFGGIDMQTETVINAVPADVQVNYKATGKELADPFNATPEQLKDAYLNDKKPADVKPAVDELPATDEILPEQTGGFDEKAWLQDHGVDDYETVEDAILGYRQKLASLEPEYQRVNGSASRLEKAAQKLGMTPDELLGAFDEADPRSMAQHQPGFKNLDTFLGKGHFTAEFAPIISEMAQAILADVSPNVASQFARLFNDLEAQVNEFKIDMSLDKFTRDEKNAEWRGRENEIKEALKINPQWKNKPNAIDLARRFILAGVEPKSVKQTVNETAKQKILDYQKRQKEGKFESPGRANIPGQLDLSKLPLGDPRRVKAIDADIDARLRRGEQIG